MYVGVVGLNHRLADLKLRELLAKCSARRFGAGQSLHLHHEFILLSTCNRTEIYFSSPDLTETHNYILNILRREIDLDFDQKLYSFFHGDCFQHLVRVTSGLDSAIVFETEIQGQVKVAYEQACRYKSFSFDMHYLFQKSLKVAKKVRGEVQQERGVPDIEHAIYNTGCYFFRETRRKKILFVGASAINLKILHFFKNKEVGDITLCNRTDETANKVAEKYPITILKWSSLKEWVNFDWVIFGTKSPSHLIDGKALRSSCTRDHSKLIIDLSVPRNVDPEMAKEAGIALFNIDQINRMVNVRKKQVQSLVDQAENFVSYSSTKQVAIFHEKQRGRAMMVKAIQGV